MREDKLGNSIQMLGLPKKEPKSKRLGKSTLTTDTDLKLVGMFYYDYRHLLKENKGKFDLNIPPVKISDEEEITYEAATTTLKRAVRFYSTIQTQDGHWAGEMGGPMFFTPPLILGLYDWSRCNPLPPEFRLLPSGLPVHPGGSLLLA
ncbi:hypothetical protein MKW98_001896 [Papaver atlanticum]|uniref:Squalene cyclase N-terminal domain-containing protein n=1 Tax=Papaver atlanticum TaxID=357466 RepID=A0AAD4XNG4_9MAGN|nr:hypothetical protein MKW98_001896 [Papaver atlanticum]